MDFTSINPHFIFHVDDWYEATVDEEVYVLVIDPLMTQFDYSCRQNIVRSYHNVVR